MPARRAYLRWPALLAPLLGMVGCRTTIPASPAGIAEDEEWSRIVVHASLEPPVGLRLAAGVALVGGAPNPGGELPVAPFERVETFPVERRCRMQSVCSLVVRKRFAGVVFAFDPMVEVEIVPPSGPGGRAEVRYRDPASLSAALAEINERSAALESACRNTKIEKARRLEQAEPLERGLRKIAAAVDRAVAERAAWLALVQGQCTGSPENRAIAKRLLDTLEPSAPELGPWTDALLSLGVLAGEPARAEAFVDAVIDHHPDPAVGGWLLFRRLNDLGEGGDPRAREAIEQRLESPRFGRTAAAALAMHLAAARDSVALVPGDPWPAIGLANVNGGTIQTDEETNGPRLVYFSASWCKGCVQSLPDVRLLAAAHPDLRIIYVLWDGPNDAREFVETRGPVPGDVAWTDERTREQVTSLVMRYAALPSFVLVDRNGTVVATSDDTELAEVGERLDMIGVESGRENVCPNQSRLCTDSRALSRGH